MRTTFGGLNLADSNVAPVDMVGVLFRLPSRHVGDLVRLITMEGKLTVGRGIRRNLQSCDPAKAPC